MAIRYNLTEGKHYTMQGGKIVFEEDFKLWMLERLGKFNIGPFWYGQGVENHWIEQVVFFDDNIAMEFRFKNKNHAMRFKLIWI
jgi:hypothetical protein